MSGAGVLEDWTEETREAFWEHLNSHEAGLRAAVLAGETLFEYAVRWQGERDQAAVRSQVSAAELAARVLELPAPERGTVRGYLVGLLGQFWADGADQKYGMTGDSTWRYDLYGPLARAGLIPSWVAGYGIGHRALGGQHHPEDKKRADALIAAAIRLLGGSA